MVLNVFISQDKPQMTMLNVSEEGNITIRIIATGKPNPLIRWYYPNVEKAKSVVSVIAGKTMTLEIPPDSVDLFGIFKFNLSNEVGWQVGYVNVTPKSKKNTHKEIYKNL